jgi:hypothetical protein
MERDRKGLREGEREREREVTFIAINTCASSAYACVVLGAVVRPLPHDQAGPRTGVFIS